ncbi:MAG TPA: hypothetical protein VHA57_13825 [Actinomycetota bacterium]|nr:hypothetical protein [Actinomycetota bacterium]
MAKSGPPPTKTGQPTGKAGERTGQASQGTGKASQGTGKAGQSGAQTGQAPAATAGSGAAAGNRLKPTPTAGAKPPAKPAAKPAGGAGTQGPSPRQREARERRAKEIEKRKAAEEAAAKARRQRQTYTYGVIGAVVVIGAVLFILLKPTATKPTSVSSNVPTGAIPTATAVATPTPGPLGPEGIPVPNGNPLADTTADTKGHTVNGIQCNTNEQLAYHHHAHLTIFVNGEPAQVPYGIGIDNYQVSQSNGQPYVGSGSCFYWLHTHAADGIIHIESPSNATFSLGDFFAEWGQPLSATQVGPDKGTVTAFYNGKLYTGPDPASLPLTEHAQIQLDIATSVYTGPLIAPETLTDWRGL